MCQDQPRHDAAAYCPEYPRPDPLGLLSPWQPAHPQPVRCQGCHEEGNITLGHRFITVVIVR